MDSKESSETDLQHIWVKVQQKLKITSRRIGSAIPYIAVDHRYDDIGSTHLTWWTNGFWAGLLWQMYHATQDQQYLEVARIIEKKLDAALAQEDQLDHDVGFMWLNAAVTDYKTTNDPEAKARGLKAAQILAGRYQPSGRYLLAWNGVDKKGQVIVDCFMNLPLLYWASETFNQPEFAQIATNHAYTATKALVRADGSVNHIAVFEPQTGELLKTLGGQGYGEGSAWSRGQAWGIYGLALAYRNTNDSYFLNQAKLVANAFIANVALSGYVSHIDFRAPEEPVYWDTTATAIAICGLLELSQYLPTDQQQLYHASALKMFWALTERFCDFNPADDELLTGGSAKYHRASDREVPIIYGDTFYIEALLRLLALDLTIY
ncbi:glycoside hydrolase family 88 protein [Latilactobacillus sakei]|uniref:Glycoside hydrolase family 88 protein n=1 Tax=Latilactobacillus sakei TaxID=1599 RepID=A0AAF0GNC8_LATSK|nr:glycoside hydrolase family 88 protein [Latilactobacillus sakei]WGI19312.1 glycoside hydrolase family 88 protein [Latilactobacillus sakei]